MYEERYEFAIEEEYACMLSGVALHDFYSSPKTMYQVLRHAKVWLEEKFGAGRFVSFYPMLSSYAEASLLGLDIEFPPGNESPWPKAGHIFESIQDAAAVQMRFGHQNDLVSRTLDFYRQMREMAGSDEEIVIEKCVNGPITTGIMLRGQDLFLDMYDDPEETEKFLAKVTDASIFIREKIEEATGKPMVSTWIYDDFAGMLPPDLYLRYAIPCYRRIYDHFGRFGRILHSEYLHPKHLQIAKKELDITYFNPASAENLTIAQVAEVMGSHFDWQIKPADLLLKEDELSALMDAVLAERPPMISIYPYWGVKEDAIALVLEKIAAYNRTGK